MQYLVCDELNTVRELRALEPQWRELVGRLPEANLFYTPALLTAALESGVQSTRWKVLTFREQAGGPLVALVPISQRPARKAWLWPHWGLLRHVHCYWCEPLLLPEHRNAVWRALLCKFPRGFDAPWIGPGHLPPGTPGVEYENFQRAAIDLSGLGFPSYEDYLKRVLDGDARKKSRARERKAQERGELIYEELGPSSSLEQWLEDFMEVEGSGWKGSEKTSIASSMEHKKYFTSLCSTAYQEGSLRLARVGLKALASGTVQTLAVRCSVICNRREWTLKIGFQEKFKDLAPGVLLEQLHLRALCAAKIDRLIDSCSSPDNRMLNSLWNSRIEVRSTLHRPRNLLQFVYGSCL